MTKLYPLPIPALVTFFFLCTASVVLAQAPGGSKKSITDIPLKAHSHEVDIFFNDEKPKEPFYKVGVLEQRADPGTSMDDMLLKIKKAAQAGGFDGILIGDLIRQAGNVVTYANANGMASYQELAGIGIRYRRTIDYMDTILKEQVVSIWTDDNTEPKVFTMKYDFYGDNLSLNDPFIYKFFDNELFPFEDAAAPYAPFASWQYKYDPKEQVFAKKKVIDAFSADTYRFYYENGRLTKGDITVMPPGEMKKIKSQLDPVYNTGGQLIGRRLIKDKNLVWEDAIYYRLDGMVDKLERFKTVNGRKVLLFQIKNAYYSDASLPQPEH